MRTRTTIFTGIAAIGIFATSVLGQSVASLSPGSSSGTVADSVGTGSVTSPGAAPVSQFVLGAADVIHINVWKNSDLSQTVTVGPDGFVSLPLLGEVHVAGQTANQLGQSLASRFSTYIVAPQVTVSVVDIRSRQVFVLGQVSRPGGYPLIGPVTVLQLLAEAGGLSNYANRRNITILRAKSEGAQKIGFNYNNAVHGDARQNISLEPGDTVIVP